MGVGRAETIAEWHSLRRQRPDTEPVSPPDGLEMTIQEVFWIGAPPDAKLSRAKRRITEKAPRTVLLGRDRVGFARSVSLSG